MNQKKAKRLRKMLELDLSQGSEQRESGYLKVDTKYIGVIDGVNGNHDIREEDVLEHRSHQDRYLYRQLKKIYTNKNREPEVREQLIADLNQTKSHKEEDYE